jgi:hypothetical protein
MRKPMQQGTTTRPFVTLGLLLLVLSSTLGCAQLADIVRRSRGEAPPPPSVPGSSEPTRPGSTVKTENSLVKKTNLYISECYNRYSNRIVEGHNRYLQWVKNPEQGPTGKETIVYGLYDVNGDGADCEKAVAEAKTIEPQMPSLEASADTFVSALRDVISEIRGINTYYEQEDYKDDAFAKGKAAHAGLMAAFAKFKEANTVFAAEVDALEDEAAQQELARLNSEGKTYEALVVESGMKAKKVKNLLQNKEFEQITADELNPLIEDFGATVEQLRAQEVKTAGPGYVRSCDEFMKAMKEMMRRIRDGQRYSESERMRIRMGAGFTVDGSPQKVIKAYNDLVQSRRFARF